MNRGKISSTQRIETEKVYQIEMLGKKWVPEMKNNFSGPNFRGPVKRIGTAEERISKQKPRELFLADLYSKTC